MLHHHHRIGAARHGSAGHDLDRFARLHFARERLARAHFADHEQIAGQIGGAHREPVANGARDGRVVAIGQHRLGQHAASDFRKAHLLGGRLGTRCAYLIQHTLARLFEGECGHDCYCTFGVCDSSNWRAGRCSSGPFDWKLWRALSIGRRHGSRRMRRSGQHDSGSKNTGVRSCWGGPCYARWLRITCALLPLT